MGSATIKVFKNNGDTFEYDRATVWADYYRGYIDVDYYNFVEIKSIDELINKMKEHDIINYVDDWIDVDEFISEMIKKYGEDFEPNDDEWYENSKGYGTDGFVTSLYLEEYENNKVKLQSFIEKLKKLEVDDVEKIILFHYDYDDGMDEDDVDPEMWILVSENGELVEGELDETDQLF